MNGMTRREQQVTDINEIIEILEKSKVVHIGMIDGDEPYVVPMNYGYTLEDGKLLVAKESGGFIHLINSGACCLDANGEAKDADGKASDSLRGGEAFSYRAFSCCL